VAEEQTDLTNITGLVAVAAQAIDMAAAMASSRTARTLDFKADRDMVSDVDIDIERSVRAYLGRETPHIGFLGEEEGLSGTATSLRWTLDPIDGTANYVAGVPLFAISLALVDGQHSLAGVIDVPPLKERYVAIRGQGATLNGERIQVRPTQNLTDAVVATGDYSVSPDTSISQLQLAITSQLARRAQRVRMVGSAAIDLAWLASGRFDATIMLSNKPWDTAAGVIIAREAGAEVVDKDGSHHDLRSSGTVAASAILLPRILDLLAQAARACS
jgi:myo-inositol-1(or 4)-monophosphatase